MNRAVGGSSTYGRDVYIIGVTRMGRNRMKEILKAGGVPFGVAVQTFNHTVIELAGSSGMDFVWLDFEHNGFSPFDIYSLEDLARTCEAAGISPLVRIPLSDDKLIGKVLDCGILNILFTDVRDRSDAERAVKTTKFFPFDGRTLRSGGTGRSFGWNHPTLEMGRQSDDETMIGVMVESAETVANLESILSVPGIEFMVVGALDLSISLGVHFQRTSDEVKRQSELAFETAKRMGAAVAYLATDTESARKAVSAGYRIVRLGVDTAILAREFKKAVSGVRQPGN